MPTYATPSATNPSAARTQTSQQAHVVPPVVKKAAPLVVTVVSIAVLRSVLRARRGSRSIAQRRGLVLEGTSRRSDDEDPFGKDALRKYNVVKVPELTEEQVNRARARRARDLVDFTLDDVMVPEDHPFAVKNDLTEEERENIRKNLNAESPREKRKLRQMPDGMKEE